MNVQQTALAGVLLIQPRVFEDARGFFFESYNEARFREAGIDKVWRQDNHARSLRGTLRGLHYQRGAGQAKLIRCVRGRIWDVAVDIRPGSPTLGQWTAAELSEENRAMMFVAEGFAHGYAVLSDAADVLYKCNRLYDPALEAGIAWDDPQLAVAWPVEAPILSDRDRNNPSFAQYLAAAEVDSQGRPSDRE